VDITAASFIFQIVVESGRLLKGVRTDFIAQPALSQQLAKAEAEVRACSLLIRSAARGEARRGKMAMPIYPTPKFSFAGVDQAV